MVNFDTYICVDITSHPDSVNLWGDEKSPNGGSYNIHFNLGPPSDWKECVPECNITWCGDCVFTHEYTPTHTHTTQPAKWCPSRRFSLRWRITPTAAWRCGELHFRCQQHWMGLLLKHTLPSDQSWQVTDKRIAASMTWNIIDLSAFPAVEETNIKTIHREIFVSMWQWEEMKGH